jgi:hypothetical protein
MMDEWRYLRDGYTTRRVSRGNYSFWSVLDPPQTGTLHIASASTNMEPLHQSAPDQLRKLSQPTKIFLGSPCDLGRLIPFQEQSQEESHGWTKADISLKYVDVQIMWTLNFFASYWSFLAKFVTCTWHST